MKKTKPLVSGRLFLILLITVVGLFSAHIFLQYLNWIVYGQQSGAIYELTNRFDLDDEVSVGTWFSQIVLLGIGVTAFIAARVESLKPAKRMWALIGFLGVGLSIDEGSGLHEYILQMVHNILYKDQIPTGLRNAWLIVLPFILLISIWLIYNIRKFFERKLFIIFAASISLFLIGAVGVDQLTSLTPRESFVHQGLLVGIEELFELFASSLVLYGIVNFLERKHSKKFKQAFSSIQSS